MRSCCGGRQNLGSRLPHASSGGLLQRRRDHYPIDSTTMNWGQNWVHRLQTFGLYRNTKPQSRMMRRNPSLNHAREALFFMAGTRGVPLAQNRKGVQSDWLRLRTCGVVTERTATAVGISPRSLPGRSSRVIVNNYYAVKLRRPERMPWVR
jgi:hypothetical protein